MDDVHARYAPMLKDIAAYYADDERLCAQLAATTVIREEWDDDRSGGHFWMEVSPSATPILDATVDARTRDNDDAIVDVILHTVDGYLNWGEWFRYDGEPVSHWPLQVRMP
jgi:hypothetical protein